MENKITITNHYNINVVRDDLLTGGTKAVLMPYIVNDSYNEYVYASTVYGGMQIALADYCNTHNKQATIFCAKRGKLHRNTLRCKQLGAKIIQIPDGMLTVVEARAREYAAKHSAFKIDFGGASLVPVLIKRVKSALAKLKREPDEIWCAVGSGALLTAIVAATHKAKVIGVPVGRNYQFDHKRVEIMPYGKPFGYESKFDAGFPSMPNYDLKAFELCVKHHQSKNTLFWNVAG